MLTASFVILQLLSLGVMLLFIHEYRRITFKHEQLLSSIEPGTKPTSSFHSSLIIWIYAIVTLGTITGMSVYFYILMS